MNTIRRQFRDSYLARYAELHPFDPDDLSSWELPVVAGRLSEGIVEEESTLLALVKEKLQA